MSITPTLTAAIACGELDPPRASVLRVADDELLLPLFKELLDSAMCAGTICSIFNWRYGRKHETCDGFLQQHLPQTPHVFSESQLILCSEPVFIEFWPVILRYYTRLEVLKSAVMEEQSSANSDHAARSKANSLDIHCKDWRALALYCREALVSLSRCIDMSIIDSYSARLAAVIDMLAEVANGGCPCVDDRGRIATPHWADRRTLARKTVNMHAYFVVGTEVLRTTVLDVDERGLGVYGLPNVNAGTIVHLLLKPGRSISGHVVWSRDDRCGIRLDQALPPGSSLHSLIE